eukprot:g4671.t1
MALRAVVFVVLLASTSLAADRAFTYRSTHGTECDCDPAKTPSHALVCKHEVHTCRYTHANHYRYRSQAGDWTGAKGQTSVCTGTSSHLSLRVVHPVGQADELEAHMNASHTSHPGHRCRLLVDGKCACCDCAAVHFCWSPKVHGVPAFQGPGPGASESAAAGAAFRSNKCVRMSGMNATECRAKCATHADCEGVYVDGDACMVLRRGCINRGCEQRLPAGSDPYRNGCYHRFDSSDALRSAGRGRFETGLKMAMLTAKDASAGSFLQLRSATPDGVCPPEVPGPVRIGRITGWVAGRFHREPGHTSPFTDPGEYRDPRGHDYSGNYQIRHVPDDEDPIKTVTECAEHCARNARCVAFEYNNRHLSCRVVTRTDRTLAAAAMGVATTDALHGLADPTQNVTLPPPVASVDPAGCDLSPWSGWSPCSRACGVGERVRERIVLDVKGKATHESCGHALAERGACILRPCLGVEAWVHDMYLMTARTTYPGRPTEYPRELLTNSRFRSVLANEPTAWVKDPRLVWDVMGRALRLTNPKHEGAAGIVQRYVQVRRGGHYTLRARGGGTRHAKLFVRDSANGRAETFDPATGDAPVRPRFTLAPGVVEVTFVAQSDLLDVGVFFETGDEEKVLTLTEISLTHDDTPTMSTTPGPPTPSPTPPPLQLMRNPTFNQLPTLRAWRAIDGARLAVAHPQAQTSQKKSGRAAVVELVATPSSRKRKQRENPGFAQTVRGLQSGHTYRIKITGRLQRTVGGKYRPKRLDDVAARVWVSTLDGQDIVWGKRGEDRRQPSRGWAWNKDHTHYKQTPGYWEGSLPSGPKSKNVEVTFTVPEGVRDVKVGVRLAGDFSPADIMHISSLWMQRVATCVSFHCKIEHHRCHFGAFTYWKAARSTDHLAVALTPHKI